MKRSPIARTNPKRKAKKASEWDRIYGSIERVFFVANLRCAVCERRGENAHTQTGGTGRKADADTIVPICGIWMSPTGLREGHHQELHRIGVATFEAKYGLDLQAKARETEAKWQAHLQEAP